MKEMARKNGLNISTSEKLIKRHKHKENKSHRDNNIIFIRYKDTFCVVLLDIKDTIIKER